MQFTTRGKILYIKLEEEIDHHSVQALRMKIDRALEPTDCRQMILDLGGVTFMDSSGIGMIIGRYKNARKRGGTVAIVNMSPEISRIYQISGLAKIIDSYATVEEAEEALSSTRILHADGG